MKHLILALAIYLGAHVSVAQAENLSYMISGQEQWSMERLEKDIQRTKDRMALEQARLTQMEKEVAERLSEIEAAAGDKNDNRTYDHYLGHH